MPGWRTRPPNPVRWKVSSVRSTRPDEEQCIRRGHMSEVAATSPGPTSLTGPRATARPGLEHDEASLLVDVFVGCGAARAHATARASGPQGQRSRRSEAVGATVRRERTRPRQSPPRPATCRRRRRSGNPCRSAASRRPQRPRCGRCRRLADGPRRHPAGVYSYHHARWLSDRCDPVRCFVAAAV